MSKIIEVREFGTAMWEVVIEWPNGQRFHRMRSKKDCPDELSAYVTTLKELGEEQ
jgi:hypothetical protein